jgi:colanic acid/amylovoran biosynthesis glycosyltransferase
VRIGYFTNTYPRATDTFIQREVLGLRALGIDVRTYSVRRSGADHDVGPLIIAEKANTAYLLPAGILALLFANMLALLRTPARYFKALRQACSISPAGLRALVFHLFYFQEAVLLARRMQADRITHLHNQLGDASGTVALLASTLTGVPFSITFHGPHIFFDPLHWGLREKIRQAAFICCISHYCKSQLMLFSDAADWHKLHIVHCGVDTAQFAAQQPRPAARSFLYVGRLAVEKGLPILLEAAAALAARGFDFEIRLVGDGPDRKALEAQVDGAGLADRVHFLGYADQQGVLRCLQQSDVFVLPSFAEGVPVSLMEAMACGVPVIATRIAGVSELVADGDTGLLVHASDAASLRDAMARYLTDASLRMNVATRARRTIESEFDIHTEVGKLARHLGCHVPGVSR